MGFAEELWREIGLTPAQAVGVLISSSVLYVTFTAVLRLWGQRLFANRSGTGLAVVLVLGAIMGRSMLGPNVTLSGGLLAIATLLVLESFFGAGRRAGLLGHRRPVVVYAADELDRQALRHYHLDERTIWARLRQSGITTLDQVDGIILETDGTLTIVRDGHPLDQALLAHVRGAQRLAR